MGALCFAGEDWSCKFYLEMQKVDLRYWRKHHGRLGGSAYLLIILLRHVLRVIFGMAKYVIKPAARKTTSFKVKRWLACVRCVFTYLRIRGDASKG